MGACLDPLRAPCLGGAGEGNRTLVVSLEGFCSTIELHPPFGTIPDWWRGKDSNLRRQSRQIYSLLPLTAREPLPRDSTAETRDYSRRAALPSKSTAIRQDTGGIPLRIRWLDLSAGRGIRRRRDRHGWHGRDVRRRRALHPLRREPNGERAALVGLARDLELGLVAQQHVLDDGEPEPGAAGGARAATGRRDRSARSGAADVPAPMPMPVSVTENTPVPSASTRHAER